MNKRTFLINVLVFFFVAIFVYSSLAGYLTPIINFLSSETLTLHIGKVSISIYSFLKGIVAILLLLWIARMSLQFTEKKIKTVKTISTSNRELILKVLQIFVYFMAFFVALDTIGIDLTTLAVFSGAFGIGIGFGLQKITSNFISGLILLLEKSVEVGDMIELTDGTTGFLRHTGARYTLIETGDGKEIMIPNEEFIINRIANWTYSNNIARIEILINLSYKNDIEKATRLAIEAAKENPRCLEDPRPECYLREFTHNGIGLLLYFWIDDVTEGRLGPQSNVMLDILKKYKEHNIEMGTPPQDLHIKNFPDVLSVKPRKLSKKV